MIASPAMAAEMVREDVMLVPFPPGVRASHLRDSVYTTISVAKIAGIGTLSR
jgi:hypothetical protein